MSSLADLPELIGFFSYSRDDDEGSMGGLSSLRDAIQRELSAQLGRTKKNFRLWQDREAIAPGKLWESQIKTAIEQSVFFIPIVTPRTVKSGYCKHEFEAFLARESAVGRNDLVFPILYMTVATLENEEQWRNDPVLQIIGRRQYVDWRGFRHRRMDDTSVREAIERFCSKIVEALNAPLAEPAAAEEGRRTGKPGPALDAEKHSPQQALPEPPETGRRPRAAGNADPTAPSAAEVAKAARNQTDAPGSRVADARSDGGSIGRPESDPSSVTVPAASGKSPQDLPFSTAAFDPAHHLVGSFMMIVGAWGLVFGLSLLFYDSPMSLAVAFAFSLLPAIALLAAGLGTIEQRKWARGLGIVVCLLGVLAGCFFVWVGIGVPGRRIDGESWIWLTIAVSSGALTILFAASGIYYAWRWRTWVTGFPLGESSSVAFAGFLFVCGLFGVVVLFVIGNYRYSPIHQSLSLWLAVLIAAEMAASFHCYRRFRKELESRRSLAAARLPS